MGRDPQIEAHKAWLGLVQPVGLVVSPPALVKAQAVLSANVVELQRTLQDLVRRPDPDDPQYELGPYLDDFPLFTRRVLEWRPRDLAGAAGGPALDQELELVLPDYGETLAPDYAAVDSAAGDQPLVLVRVLDRGSALDEPSARDEKRGWHASPQAKFERLLRERQVPAGLICNGHALRLVYAPKGETSGHVTFPVGAMCEVAGRPILAAMHMLLDEHRVFGARRGTRLGDLLAESRKYQNEVSIKLADQVLEALWELLRGFQAADEASGGRLLGALAREDPQHIYGGLLTVLLRSVFLLYAEDQGLMPDDPIYVNNYAVTGLYDRLREDAGRYPDTMDQRYGAWAWLLSLFRLVFDGAGHRGFQLPERHGQLFNPDEYPFLEGRPRGVGRVKGERIEVPRVSDGCIYRMLEDLLILDGERLSYRALDVEQIGSVYEAMMGFAVQQAHGRSIAVKPKHIVFDVDALLERQPAARKKWLKDHAELDPAPKALKAIQAADTADEVVAALGRRLSPRTPRLIPPGALYLQPGEERRRSGSHYTPRELTEPIVRNTLRPVLEGLGPRPTPERILELKICDPAMGSGAFLVEACRQLAEQLVQAWELHDRTPELSAGSEPLLYARRLVAQNCLYGVDKNPFAVNLAKLSLWLVTLARDHAFTFLDHALKCGDSLVGLSRRQLAAFDWKTEPDAQADWIEQKLKKDLETALDLRRQLQQVEEGDYKAKKRTCTQADEALHDSRLVGNLAVAAFFAADKPKQREQRRQEFRAKVDAWRETGDRTAIDGLVEELKSGDYPIQPLHWEIEFPEVFDRDESGFDAMVGNPPFAGKNTTINSNRRGYLDWLKSQHEQSHGNSDLVAHFFRRAFNLIRQQGTFGLIATNTIGQGDTRATGLRWICTKGGSIYEATRRVKWPGHAAVVVSVVHIHKGPWKGPHILDNRQVPTITAFLFHAGGHENPATLAANAGKSFVGSYVLGMGFTFDDTDKKGIATPISEMKRLIEKDPRNAERIFPYIGGHEINTSPTQNHHRYVINFGEMSEAEAREWPDLMAIVENKVKPERLSQKRETRKRFWWRFGEPTPALFSAIAELERVLVVPQTSSTMAFSFQSTGKVWGHTVIVLACGKYSFFCILQSQIHRRWVEMFAAKMKDDLRYIPSDCFNTYPFPNRWNVDTKIEKAGKTYYEFRAGLMAGKNEGLTKIYNRFHDPIETDLEILRLRELHRKMDRLVLDAYGWYDIPNDCDFFLDYEIDEETWGTKKKPYRYRWPDEVQDEVLARLLALNKKRAEEERLAGVGVEKANDGVGSKVRKASGRKARKATSMQLFEVDDD